MKKVILIAALIASAQASAFWGWNDGQSNTHNNGYFNSAGNSFGTGEAEADFTFDFNFTASMRGEGRGNGNGYGYGSGSGYGQHAQIPYYAAPYGYLPPVAPVAPPAE